MCMCTNVFIYDYHHQEQASEADYHIIFWGYEYLHRIYSCVIIMIMMMRGHTHTHFQYVQENMIFLLSKMSKLSFVSNKIIFRDY